jgi:hypothetical protein
MSWDPSRARTQEDPEPPCTEDGSRPTGLRGPRGLRADGNQRSFMVRVRRTGMHGHRTTVDHVIAINNGGPLGKCSTCVPAR